MNHSQHGFMKGRSYLYSKVYEVADNGDSYDVLYLDFSEAFHNVPHQRLEKTMTVQLQWSYDLLEFLAAQHNFLSLTYMASTVVIVVF